MRKIFASLLLAASLFIFPKSALAKDYSITNADFVVQLNSDGSADVTEARTYKFDGSFTWADEWILLTAKCDGCRNYTVGNFGMWEGNEQYQTVGHVGNELSGTYGTTVTSDKFYIKWNYNAYNEKKTFTLKYTIGNAITNHPDISEFYWQLIGDQWDKGTGNVTAKVYLPGQMPSDRLWGFGHGPLNGKVSIPNNIQVDFSASNLPAKQFFEVRVLFKKLDGALFAQTGSSNLNKILAEEKTFGLKTRLSGFAKIGIILLLIAIPVWRLVYWFFVWKRVGDDKPTPEVNLSGKLHEPPDELEPALVEALSSWNMMPTSKSIVGTILNLVRKKVLEIKVERGKTLFGNTKYDYSLKIVNMKYIVDEKLSEREKNLVNFLFIRKGKDEIKFSEIKNMGATDRTSAFNFWKKWQKDAVGELIDIGLIDPDSKKTKDKLVKEMGLTLLVLFMLFAFGNKLLTLFNSVEVVVVVIVLIFLFMVAGILSSFMYRKTDNGLQEYANWKAFKSYIKDYSVTKNYPIDSVILWEKYLVYGATLGISLKALSQLPISFPESAYAGSGLYVAGMASGGTGGIGNVGESFSGMSAAFTSLGSSFQSFGASGSGSSGGFSGGGGGGGGGAG